MEQFLEELRSVESHKPPISANKINGLAKLAFKIHKQHYKNVVNEVEKFNKRCKPQYRLTVLYIIDAIVRYSMRKLGAKDVYAARFAQNLERSLDYIFQVPENDQKAVRKVIGLWHKNKVFSPSVIDGLVMVSIRRTGIPPDLPDDDLPQEPTPSAGEGEPRSPSPPSLSPSPTVERVASQGNVLQQIKPQAFSPPPSSGATPTPVQSQTAAPSASPLHISPPASGNAVAPAPAVVAPPTDPRLAAASVPVQPPTDPRLAAMSNSAAPVPSTSVAPTALHGNGGPVNPGVDTNFLVLLGAQMAGLLPSSTLSNTSVPASAFPAAATPASVPSMASSTTTAVSDPRLGYAQPEQPPYVAAPAMQAEAAQPSAWPQQQQVQQAPQQAEEADRFNPLYFDYGEDDDDDTRLEEQRLLRKEHEERLAQLEKQQQAAAAAATASSSYAPTQQKPEQLAAALASFYGSDAQAAASNPARAGASSSKSEVYDPFSPSSPPPASSSFSAIPVAVSASRTPTDGVAPGMTKIPTTTCYIGGLPAGSTHEMLRAHFSGYGRIVRLKVMDDKNIAFVTFVNRRDADVLKAQGDAGQAFFGGQPLKVGWARGANPPGTKENFNMETGETLVTVEEATRYYQQNQPQAPPAAAGGFPAASAPPPFAGGRGQPAYPPQVASVPPGGGGGGGGWGMPSSGGAPPAVHHHPPHPHGMPGGPYGSLPSAPHVPPQQPFPPHALPHQAGGGGGGGPSRQQAPWEDGGGPQGPANKRRRFEDHQDPTHGAQVNGGPPPAQTNGRGGSGGAQMMADGPWQRAQQPLQAPPREVEAWGQRDDRSRRRGSKWDMPPS